MNDKLCAKQTCFPNFFGEVVDAKHPSDVSTCTPGGRMSEWAGLSGMLDMTGGPGEAHADWP